MTNKSFHARRALMYVPGSDEGKILKAAASDLDCAILDLEDGVAFNRKDEARGIGLGPEHDWASHGADSYGAGMVAYEIPKKAAKLDLSKLTRGMV